MYPNYNTDVYTNNSYSYVGYADYTNSSSSGFIIPIYMTEFKNSKKPNTVTHNAIIEAENKENLQSFETIDDFFNDLER